MKQKFNHLSLFYFLIFSVPYFGFCQNNENQNRFKIYSNTYLNAGNVPTWLRNNQNGTIDLSGNFQQIGFGFKDYQKFKNSKYRLEYAFEPVVNVGLNNKIRLKEAYSQISNKTFELFIGRKVQTWGLVDSVNSSGSMAMSNNALPLPVVQFGTKSYISILGKGFLSIKFLGGHGWFGNETYTDNAYIHYKSFFGKIGRDNQKLNFSAGINNYIQWGGFSETLKDAKDITLNGQLPNDINTFIGLVLPFPSIRRKFPPKIDLANDSNNYLGNVSGTVDFSVSFKNSSINTLFYRQIPYEIGSLFTSLVNADDGLYGLTIKPQNQTNWPLGIKNITLEGFHSINQGSYFSNLKRIFYNKFLPSDPHNYYNHGQYLDGWSYRNKAIGNPFIFNNSEIKPENVPNKSQAYGNFNRVRAFFVNVNGILNTIDYGFKLSYWPSIAGFGPKTPFKQWAGMAYLGKNIRNDFKANVALGVDQGDMFKNSIGTKISLSKSFDFKLHKKHLHIY